MDECDEIEQMLDKVAKPHRPSYLLQLLKGKYTFLDDLKVWWLIVDTWVESESNHIAKEVWEELFSLRKVPKWYTEHLPDEMTIFRGGNPEGISWSLYNEQGQWFAERYGDNESFWGMKIKKEDILFYTNLRGEEEVVIIPKNHHKGEIYAIGYSPRVGNVANHSPLII